MPKHRKTQRGFYHGKSEIEPTFRLELREDRRNRRRRTAGEVFVRKLRTRTTPSSPKELQRREVFRQAAACGKMVQDDCGLRAVYARTAILRQTSPYQVA